MVRFPAGPRVSLKTADPPKGNGLGQKKKRATEIALEAARDSSFPYDCFGFLMRQRLLAAFPGTLSGLRLLPSPSSLFVRWLPLPASLPLCVLVCGLLSLCFGLLLCLLVCFCLVLLVCSSLFFCWIGGLCLLPAY